MITFQPYPGNDEILSAYKGNIYLQAIKKADQSKAFTLLDKGYLVQSGNKSYFSDIEEALKLYNEICDAVTLNLRMLYPSHKIEKTEYWRHKGGRCCLSCTITPKQGNCYPMSSRQTIEILGFQYAILPCTRCQGTGVYQGLVSSYPCSSCNKQGFFIFPSHKDTILHCIATQGKNKGKIRSSAPTTGGKREKYFWRMYNFYTGRDVTLPVVASMDMEGDPFADLIDEWACEAATINKNLSGLEAWKRALLG